MPFAWNLPYMSVFLTMITAILLSVIPGAKRAYWITVCVSAIVTLMSLCFLSFIVRADASYTFTMGKFPAPFGNEIRFGPLQGLLASVFAAVMCLSLLPTSAFAEAEIPEEEPAAEDGYILQRYWINLEDAK